MKKLEKTLFKIIAIILTIIIFIFINDKYHQENKIIKIDTITKIKYKEKLKIDTSFIPKWNIIKEKIYISDTVFRTDTIIKYITNYLTKNVYKDTILNDTSGLIVLTDTIYKNLIKSRKSDISLYNKTVIKQSKNNALFIGVGSMLNQELNINLNAHFKHNKHMFGVGYGTNKTIYLHYNYMIY